MNKIVKVLTGICLGIILVAGVNCTAKASSIQYYVVGNNVYAAPADAPYNLVALPQGAVIPAHATVYVDRGSNVNPSWGLLAYSTSNPYVSVFKTNSNTAVGYTGYGVNLAGTWAPADYNYYNYYWNYYNYYDYYYHCGYYYPANPYVYYPYYGWVVENVDWSNTYAWNWDSILPAAAVQETTVSVGDGGMVFDMEIPQIVADIYNFN